MRNQLFTSLCLLISLVSCNSSDEYPQNCNCHSESITDKNPGMQMALLASRINSLEELKEIIEINYFNRFSEDSNGKDTRSMVRLKHCSNGVEVISELKAGISQNDIINARNGNMTDKLTLLYNSPFAIANRMDINKIYLLARVKPYLFGEGDVAFYGLAAASVRKINPELTNGQFSNEQLHAPDDNPVDNYVDMINNEWGQELGKELKRRYNINSSTCWTAELLVNYLNEVQNYYSWAFQIGFEPFKKEDEEIIRFVEKINLVKAGMPIVTS